MNAQYQQLADFEREAQAKQLRNTLRYDENG